MHTIEETAEAFDQNLARNLRRQIDEWKTRRSPLRTRAAGGVVVERRVGARRSPGRPRVDCA
jgi:hypothetical protein